MELNCFVSETSNAPLGIRVGKIVRGLASHHCELGSIVEPGVISGMSLLFVLVPFLRVHLHILQFSSLHKNQYSEF